MMTKRARSIAALCVLFLLGVGLVAATNQPFILQLFNGGTALGTFTNYGAINCSTGMSCSLSGSTFTLTASSSGGVPNPAVNGIVSCTGTNCSTSSASTALPSTTTATTQSSGDATTKVATDAFVGTAVAGALQSATVVITSAQFLAMANTVATDITIVAAPGAGKVIVPVYAVVNMNYPASGGVAYTTGNGNLIFYQTGGGAHNVTYSASPGGANLSSTYINGSSSAVSFGVPLSAAGIGGAVSTFANNALNMNVNAGTQYLAGNSTFTVTVWYQIVSVS